MAIASPAVFQVTDPDGNILSPANDVLSIENPKNGEYKIKITPIEPGGKYTFYFGRVSSDDVAWDDFSSDTIGSEVNLEYYVDWDSAGLGADPIDRALQRLELIKNASEVANINSGEKQVFLTLVQSLDAEISALAFLDENRIASILRTALHKVNQMKNAWNYPDPEFAEIVIYNLRMFTRDVIEARSNF